jgi:RNA polymerase sigma factor (sigma-70 family)
VRRRSSACIKHAHARFRYAAAAIVGSEEAHDAVQEGFARAFAERASYREGSLEGWVRRIVLRTAIDLRRQRRSGPFQEDFDAELIRSEREPELAAAIRMLPPRRRLVVFLRYFADLPYAEIASMCEISEGTVAASLARAHAELRAALEPEGVGR